MSLYGHPRWLSVVILLSLMIGAPTGATGQTTKNLIQNGDFKTWEDDLPSGWTSEVGATSGGQSPTSKIEKLESGGIQLSGNASTKGWLMLTQRVAVESGDTVELRYRAKANGLKLEARQFNNCYVGAFIKDGAGKRLGLKIASVYNSQFDEDWKIFRIPKNGAIVDIVIFLSKTGQLTVDNVSLNVLDTNASFDILIKDMDRHYSYFDLKNIDWDALTKKYREKANAAGDVDEFIQVVASMLAEMKDIHTWVYFNNRRISKYRSSYDANFDFSIVDAELKEIKRFGKLGVVGQTADGLGYVRVSSLSGVSNEQVKQLMNAIRGLFDCPGIIVDLRQNGGGAEGIAMAIGGMFTDEPLMYAKQQFRSGPKHSDLVDAGVRLIQPSPGKNYTKNVACLIGPGTVSSAEGFAMIMSALPECKMFGQPTRGASGNPEPVELPNGVDVFYSRWISQMPDGTPIEDRGVQPDVAVEHEQGNDPTFQEAVRWIVESRQ